MAADASFKHLVEQSRRFLVAVEVETSRGLVMDERASNATALARRLSEYEQVDLLCFTDNPGGNPHLRPEALVPDLLTRGQNVAVNLSCKDYNRNGIESRLWALGSAGVDNILALTGDYPAGGFGGQAQPVFDVDSVGVLEMVRQMNAGLPVRAWGSVGREARLRPTSFFPGAAVSPFKKFEGELMTQYFKLALKVRTGAKWAVTQIGFDSRKLDELARYVTLKGISVPLIGSVFILTEPAAALFHRWGVPGVAVTDELLALAQKQAASRDRGRKFFTEFAAKQTAVLRGLGYRGIYLSGRPRLERLQEVLELERSFAPGDWREFASEINFSQPEEFHYFEPGDSPGLSSSEVSRAYIASKARRRRTPAWLRQPLHFTLGRAAHRAAFEPGSAGFAAGRAVYTRLERMRLLRGAAHAIEQAVKVPLYGCQDCGDCSLPDVAYLCPHSQCAKDQRNGPCGGTKAGKCEVLDKECIWVRAYDRLKALGREEQMLDRPVVFADRSLKGTSAWGNTFLGRDHSAAKHRSQPV